MHARVSDTRKQWLDINSVLLSGKQNTSLLKFVVAHLRFGKSLFCQISVLHSLRDKTSDSFGFSGA